MQKEGEMDTENGYTEEFLEMFELPSNDDPEMDELENQSFLHFLNDDASQRGTQHSHNMPAQFVPPTTPGSNSHFAFGAANQVTGAMFGHSGMMPPSFEASSSPPFTFPSYVKVEGDEDEGGAKVKPFLPSLPAATNPAITTTATTSMTPPQFNPSFATSLAPLPLRPLSLSASSSSNNLPSQMATLSVHSPVGGSGYASKSPESARKKRKHEQPEEPAISLQTQHDPQRLVSVHPSQYTMFTTASSSSSASAGGMPFCSTGPSNPSNPFTIPATSSSVGSSSAPASLPIPDNIKPEAKAAQQLNELHSVLMHQKEQLQRIHQVQRQLMQTPEMEAYKLLDADHKQLKTKIDEELAFLLNVFSTCVLDPPELHKYAYLRQELDVQVKQLELYQRELQLLLQPPVPRCIAALVIVKQPFPMVITKNKQISEDDLEARLLCGTAMDIRGCSPVKTSLIIDTHQTKGIEENALECCVQPLDPVRQSAKFPLKFQMGTRKNTVTLKFSMQIKVGEGNSAMTATVESDTSRPFVVITNEIQWQGSAGTLLKRDAFGGQLEITWPQFANTLQRHVLKATKQDPIRPARCLSGYDLRYIKARFFGDRDIISQKDFDGFWSWFGKNLQILRYQRHICSLWQQGLVYGFLTRVDVNEALSGQEPGTFLLRFSERHPGQFGVAYVGMEPPHKIKHYLVQKSDTAGAKKTLPDFLGDCPQFRYLLQLSSNPTTGEAIFRKLQKDHCLKPFYSKRSPPPSGSGYDPL